MKAETRSWHLLAYQDLQTLQMPQLQIHGRSQQPAVGKHAAIMLASAYSTFETSAWKSTLLIQQACAGH